MRKASLVVRAMAGVALLAAMSAAPAAAQTLFFNGLPDGVSGLSSEFNTVVSQSMVYDNFVVGGSGWNVTDLFGYFGQQDLVATDAQWEIRTGVSAGNGGTLVASGTSAATQTLTGNMPFGLTEDIFDIGGLSIFLAPGTYWMGISPVGDGNGRAFIETTSGASEVNSNLDLTSFWNSSFFGQDFAPAGNPDGLGEAADFAYGVDGTLADSTVPEPSTMAMMGMGLVGIAGAAKRRRRK